MQIVRDEKAAHERIGTTLFEQLLGHGARDTPQTLPMQRSDDAHELLGVGARARSRRQKAEAIEQRFDAPARIVQ
jgi:hypothetical protein